MPPLRAGNGAPHRGGGAASPRRASRAPAPPHLLPPHPPTHGTTARAGSFARYEELRRHPTALILLRCLFDAGFAVSVLAETGLRLGGQVASADCRGFSFVFQATVLGSELSLACVSYDLFSALRNPFVDYKRGVAFYRAATALVAAASAGALVGAGPSVYGLTAFGLCWVRPADSVANGYLWLFFYR